MELPLPEKLATLAAALITLTRDGILDADDPRTKSLLDAQIGAIIAMPAGAAELVTRYGGDPRPAVVRPLAFLLAVAVNDRDRAHSLAAPVFAMIEALGTDDPWPRLNLCTAVQRLLMFGAMGPGAAPSPAAVARLLRESLAGPPAVRATAAAVVADLIYGGHAALVAADELAALQATVLGLVDDADELTRTEARQLREHLANAAM